jgi:Ca2+-transporting ATPase
MAGATLFIQAWSLRNGSAHWQTMVFTVLALSQLGHVLAIRSERDTLFGRQFWTNPWLLLTVTVTGALQLATVYVPALNPIFRTQPLEASELVLALAVSAVVLVAVEVEKFALRRGWLYRTKMLPQNLMT